MVLAWSNLGATEAIPRFSICGDERRVNCVVDGDTFWMDGVKIRIADIDAPEIHPARCAGEQDLGDAATLRLQDLLNDGPFELRAIDRDEDQYGRKLRLIERGDQSIGEELVKEGVARRWEGRRRPWC
ncbi:thermonuclease family protein [Rhizobium sp. BK602]|uniref:thermonuclease family protein n=1 Tax=Rhizobium sp. BK602 TaxID=2586986 RepID=UPI001FEF47B2|nr:thermonuclease family protein [Rhizobium sp. BK602]